MFLSLRGTLKGLLFVTTSLGGVMAMNAAMAQQVQLASASDAQTPETVIVT